MLEDKDIQKMKEVFPTKENLKEAFSELQSSIDAYAKKIDTYA